MTLLLHSVSVGIRDGKYLGQGFISFAPGMSTFIVSIRIYFLFFVPVPVLAKHPNVFGVLPSPFSDQRSGLIRGTDALRFDSLPSGVNYFIETFSMSKSTNQPSEH